MGLIDGLKHFGISVVEMLFPRKCVYCSGVLESGRDTCNACQNKLSNIQDEICTQCGNFKSDCTCYIPDTSPYGWSIAPLYYNDTTRRLIKRLKRKGEVPLAKYCAAQIVACLQAQGKEKDFDLITCVPMNPVRRQEQGFNHAALIAWHITLLLGNKFSENLLKRTGVISQHHLSRRMRHIAAQVTYSIQKPALVKGRKILLIDDVSTTGATLRACSEALVKSGAAKVFCATFAYTPLQPE